jgi:hypothetical protein
VVIRSSSSRNVEQLIADLREGGNSREAAVARLRVIGSRADERLASFIASDAPADARTAALRALEGREEARARQIAHAACDDTDPAVVIAAIAVLRGWVARESGTEALDALSGVALDPRRDAGVRLAALDALSELPPDIVRPLLQGIPSSLRPDPNAAEALATLDDPLAMSAWIADHRDAPLSSLHEAVVRIREQELQGPLAQIRQAWIVARGAAHSALAERGSRVALYDLRESFDSAQTPLPLDFLSAVSTLGDATCLEPLARAWSATPTDSWWRNRLREAAADIMKRGKLTSRHQALKRVRAKYPDFV